MSNNPKGDQYIITEDLSVLVPKWLRQTLKAKKHHRLLDEDNRYFRDLVHRLKESLQCNCFPDKRVKVVVLQHNEMKDHLRPNRSGNEFQVFLDNVYVDVGTDPSAGFALSATRYVDPDWGGLAERGPRPQRGRSTGLVELEDQVFEAILKFKRWKQAKLKRWKLEEKQQKVWLTLVDDGLFEGKTVIQVLNLFKSKNAPVMRVRIALAREEGHTNLTTWVREIDKRRCKVDCEMWQDIYDWVCERDFFPGIPLAGKVVSTGRQVPPKPLRIRGLPVRAHYLQGWGDVVAWAGLNQGLNTFTMDALDLSIDLWNEIEGAVGPVRVKDLDAVPWRLLSLTDVDKELLEQNWIEALKSEREALRRSQRRAQADAK